MQRQDGSETAQRTAIDALVVEAFSFDAHRLSKHFVSTIVASGKDGYLRVGWIEGNSCREIRLGAIVGFRLLL